MNITEIMSDPRYQKALRKRMSVDPRTKAVIDISDVVGMAGKEAAETELYGKTRADQLAMSMGQLGLGEGKLKLGEGELKLGEGKLKLGEKEVGLGEKRLALKGEELELDKYKTENAIELDKYKTEKAIELDKYKAEKAIELRKEQLKNEIELKEKDLEYLTTLKDVEKREGMKTLGLSALNLGVKGMGAYYDIKEGERQEVLIQKEIKKGQELKNIINQFMINLNNRSLSHNYGI